MGDQVREKLELSGTMGPRKIPALQVDMEDKGCPSKWATPSRTPPSSNRTRKLSFPQLDNDTNVH
jgi:hypothetical protein